VASAHLTVLLENLPQLWLAAAKIRYLRGLKVGGKTAKLAKQILDHKG
jgi:hypothetical protein